MCSDHGALFAERLKQESLDFQHIQECNLNLALNGVDKDNQGFNRDGYNDEGFDRDGFDRDGYDKDGKNKWGFYRLNF